MPAFLHSRGKVARSLRTLDVRPDDTDARDYIFQPSLAPLPPSIDHRGLAPVLDQEQEGACVGFALATVIHVSLARSVQKPTRQRSNRKTSSIERVSPRMLYELGKRYDEWQGEEYAGTSLRGAMKGWHKHGVAAEKTWPYMMRRGKPRAIPDREFTPERAADAARRPLGAYYRIVDHDISHVQAAIYEGDAVLASAYVHAGWQTEPLRASSRRALCRIIPRGTTRGLHAFAIVGYDREGFIIQNSWGKTWGTGGCALLSYEDWFANRQDAWAARPAPETHDLDRKPRIWVGGFAGEAGLARAGTTAVGLDLDPQVVDYLVNTGDRGQLSAGGSLVTRREDLSRMAQQVLAGPVRRGVKHVILYAHGGLNAETMAAKTANRLWHASRERDLTSYFFIWESGVTESVWGWLKSDDDVTGPAGFSLSDAWEAIKRGTGRLVREAQRTLGKALAPTVKDVFWDEMKGRAQGASQRTGGAALFVDELFTAMRTTPTQAYHLHLVGHSAGSIYLGWLYEMKLASLLTQASNVELTSIEFMAPAITVSRAKAAFQLGGRWPVGKTHFRVHMLSPEDEASDNIQIYPSSLLTYVADHLEDNRRRVPLLGIRQDFDRAQVQATPVPATVSAKHGEFDDANHEVELVLDRIAEGKS